MIRLRSRVTLSDYFSLAYYWLDFRISGLWSFISPSVFQNRTFLWNWYNGKRGKPHQLISNLYCLLMSLVMTHYHVYANKLQIIATKEVLLVVPNCITSNFLLQKKQTKIADLNFSNKILPRMEMESKRVRTSISFSELHLTWLENFLLPKEW